MNGMLLILVLVWILNFGISWLNARTRGLVWAETKVIGGWQKILTWMGAIMSASGFTWCYLIVLLLGGHYVEEAYFLLPNEQPLLDAEAIEAGFSLGYLIIIPGVLFSGLMIWINSLVEAWRRRDLPSMGIAGWNTFAQIHNTYSAMKGMPEVWDSVSDFFGSKSSSSSSDGKGKAIMLILVLVVVAIISGILTTWAIINHYAGSREIEQFRTQPHRRRVA
jgi:hypothetical protein